MKYTNEFDKVSYCLGIGIANNLREIGVKKINPDAFMDAVQAIFAGNIPAIMPDEAENILQDFFEKLKNEEGEAAKTAGVKRVIAMSPKIKPVTIAAAYMAGADVEITGDYPGWAYRKDSPLRDKMVEIYRKLYQKEPRVRAIHAGVECGLLADKIPGLDCVSIGPDMKNIHTTEEELCISSAGRVWDYLLKLLEDM